MKYAGLDVHKRYCVGIVCRENGEVVKEGRIPSTEKDILEFFAGMGDVTVAMESSTCVDWIYDLLEENGFKVVVSNPLRTRLIAETKIKTDKIDAKVLADLLRNDYLPRSYVPPKDIRRLREICRHRILLGRMKTQIKNSIHAILARKGMDNQHRDIFTSEGILWLKSLNHRLIEKYLATLELLDKQIESAESLIEDEAMNHPEIKILTTIPGIGIYSAAVIFSEIGDINRFPTEEHLFSYAGLIPRVNQSGDHNYYGRITKSGPSNIRFVLVLAVQIHLSRVRRDTNIKRFYRKLVRKKPKNIAVVACARKMLQIIYWMLKRNEPFQGWVSQA